MAGNSGRRGAVRNPGSKKGARVGTGGHGRRALEGRGPTPKAEDREKLAKRRKAANARATTPSTSTPAGSAAPRARRAPAAKAALAAEEVIVGRNAVLEALRAGVPATSLRVVTSVRPDAKLREIISLAQTHDLALIDCSKSDLDRALDSRAHQGVALEVPEYDYAHVGDLLREGSPGHVPLLLALDSVTDPHNLGASLRSAAAFGADGVIIPQRRSVGVNSTVWKVSAGAAARVPVARASNLVSALRECQAAGYFVAGLDGRGPTPLRDMKVADGPLVVVLGSEGEGLSRLVRETCDIVVSIPIESTTESLNASVALGIALYEVARQREV